MNQSSDAAEQIVRMSLQGFEVAARVTGSGAKDVAALLLAVMKDKKKTAGKTNLVNMLKSGKELKVFSVRQEDFKKFTEEAKRYGVLYTALINKKAKDGVTDILVKAEDASKINRIVQRFNLARFDEVAIRGEIQKTKEMKSKGVKQKPIKDKIKEELHKNPIKKEEQSVNPHLAKTEKSPQSKPFLKEQKNSDKGSKIKERASVGEKLEKYKAEVKLRDQSEVKSEIKNKTQRIKLDEKDILKGIEVDKVEYGIIIDALNEVRNKLVREGEDNELVDEFIIKVLDAPGDEGYVDREGRLGAR